MDFLAFDIQRYSRPYIVTKLISDASKFRRGCYNKRIRTCGGYFKVGSESVFELADNTLFIHGRCKEDYIEQRTSVRNFIQYNTARVITNKYMKRVNP